MYLVFGSFVLAGIAHPQEIGCLPYLIIYYTTIPAMYLLLVIFSIFNLNDVSWGTREGKIFEIFLLEIDNSEQSEPVKLCNKIVLLLRPIMFFMLFKIAHYHFRSKDCNKARSRGCKEKRRRSQERSNEKEERGGTFRNAITTSFWQ